MTAAAALSPNTARQECKCEESGTVRVSSLCLCAKCHPVYWPLPTGVAVRLQLEPGVRAVALPLNELADQQLHPQAHFLIWKVVPLRRLGDIFVTFLQPVN